MEKNPRVDYESLRALLWPYASNYAITNPVIQQGHDATKVEIFGTAVDNVCYAEGVVEKMRALGHSFWLICSTREETPATINTVVVNDEVNQRKNGKAKGLVPLDGITERKAFWKKWKDENHLFLSESLGFEGTIKDKFLSGILVAMSSSKSMFQLMQEIVQEDGAHTSFGKYTLFSACTTTANSNITCVVLRVLFGNEDTKNWTIFWDFVC